MKKGDRVYWNNGYCIGSGKVNHKTILKGKPVCIVKDDLDGGSIILPTEVLFKSKEELLKSL